jgi:BirA family biotin operon repressor/biotin-[acetyl-CoA-carboxylase] ligase
MIADARAGFGRAGLLGVAAEYHESIGSTNDEAFRRAAEGAPEGLAVVAGRQLAGRGRQGRAWWDAPGASLLFSTLLYPAMPPARFPLLALAMACAVAETAEGEAGATMTVKWPNDVLHAGRKCCGVLAESRGAGGADAARTASAPRVPLVIGTGMNLNQREEDFPPELSKRATSLRVAAGGREFDPAAFLAKLLRRFERYVLLARSQGPDALWTEVTPRLPAPGTPVSVDFAGRRVQGVLAGIAASGALQIQEPGRREPTLVSTGELA